MTTEPSTDPSGREVESSQQLRLVQLQEYLRQQRETFDQRKRQDARWFVLKLAMGWTSVALLPGIALTCGYVIFNHQHFSSATETAAAWALLADTAGLVISVWRLVLGKGLEPLKPLSELSAASVGVAATTRRTRLGEWLRRRLRGSPAEAGDRPGG